MARWMLLLLLAVGQTGGTSGGIPALTDGQRDQLATARDMTGDWDEPALYPLLRNAMQWPPGIEIGATSGGGGVPDYDALYHHPADHRGELCLIEGLLGGPPQVLKRPMSQPGPWADNLQQWSVLVHRDPDEVAVVLLVDPMPAAQIPKRGGDEVRIAARFFKVWQFIDRQGQPTPYLLFVGRSAKVTHTSTIMPGVGTDTSGGGVWLALLIFIAAAGGWIIMRRVVRLSLHPRPLATRRDRKRRAGQDVDERPDDELPGSLPADPAEALRTLRDKDQSDTTERES